MHLALTSGREEARLPRDCCNEEVQARSATGLGRGGMRAPQRSKHGKAGPLCASGGSLLHVKKL